MASEMVHNLRKTFNSGVTRPITFRRQQLQALLRLLEEHTETLVKAVAQDLRKSRHETIVTELEFVKNELRGMLFKLDDYMKPEKPEKPFVNIMDGVVIQKEPLGVVLVIGAWNYPIQLTLAPLIGAIAAGNCAVLKPSELAPASAKILDDLLPKFLDSRCFKVYLGGIPETTALLNQRFDYIFFTGSTHIGKIIQQQAAKYLTPVTLELGGKSPVYLDDTVDLQVAVNRIMWGKCLNSGQSCIAPDYLLCPKHIQTKFIDLVKTTLEKWYSDKIKTSNDYGRIINRPHFDRITKLLEGATIGLGGDSDADDLYIAPTILINVKPTDTIMSSEIFGPILPIVNIESVDEAIEFINDREKPLAFYIFSNNKEHVNRLVQETSSGGVCVNDTMMHFTCETLPFGGVGHSGMGAYHGRLTFDVFSHKKGILMRDTGKFGESLQTARYPPYTEKKLNFIVRMTKKRKELLPLGFLTYFLTFALGIIVTLMGKCMCRFLEHKQQ